MGDASALSLLILIRAYNSHLHPFSFTSIKLMKETHPRVRKRSDRIHRKGKQRERERRGCRSPRVPVPCSSARPQRDYSLGSLIQIQASGTEPEANAGIEGLQHWHEHKQLELGSGEWHVTKLLEDRRNGYLGFEPPPTLAPFRDFRSRESYGACAGCALITRAAGAVLNFHAYRAFPAQFISDSYQGCCRCGGGSMRFSTMQCTCFIHAF